MPYIRIFLMSISFGFVLYFMYFMNTTPVENTEFGNMMGLKPKLVVEWNWCDKPVKELQWQSYQNPKENFLLKNKAGMWVTPNSTNSSQLIENIQLWLNQNCKTKLIPNEASTVSRVDNRLRIIYEDGKGIDLNFNEGSRLMNWENKSYFAPQYLDAIKSLSKQLLNAENKK